jgi:hypothetical protein
MKLQAPSSRTSSADFLLSWDRLGFRLALFGGLALLWILHGRVLGVPWPELVRGELAGLMPWVLLAPLVLSFGRRVRIQRPGLGRYLAAHLLGMGLIFVPYWLIQRGILLLWTGLDSGWGASLAVLVPTWKNLAGNFVNVPSVYLLVLLGAEAMEHARARRAEELQAGHLAGQLAEARLALLQRQLQPHFLFNALQAISTLLHRDPATADGLLLRLATLLRAMLDSASGQTLSLRTELELTRRYLEIEQLRFQDRLRVEWSVADSVLDVEVPSLLLLPLVENAIRHGLSPKMGPGRLKVSAGAEAATLVLTVEDDGLGATLPLQPGVGIGNTRERLEAWSGGRARLDIETRPQGGFRATVRLPLPEARP